MALRAPRRSLQWSDDLWERVYLSMVHSSGPGPGFLPPSKVTPTVLGKGVYNHCKTHCVNVFGLFTLCG